MKKITSFLICIGLLTNLASCGTILHPERKGQVDGQLDTSIVVLDAIGLLFFLVPGVIAFAVDFSNGTIYLPNGSSSSLTDEEMKNISLNGKVDMDGLSQLVSDKTSTSVLINSNEVKTHQVNKVDELAGLFTLYSKNHVARL